MQDRLHFGEVRSVDSGSRPGIAAPSGQWPEEWEGDSGSKSREGRYYYRPRDSYRVGWPNWAAYIIVAESAV